MHREEGEGKINRGEKGDGQRDRKETMGSEDWKGVE